MSQNGGILLLMTTLSLLLANSRHEHYLNDVLVIKSDFILLGKKIQFSVLDWVNDGLMSLFFLMIAIEIKKEANHGCLSDRNHRLLPILCAFGGVLFPIAIYYGMNYGNPDLIKGFAIPSATDIAFTLSVLNALRNKISKDLKIFVVTLAVVDDLIAIVIIAVFYSQDISPKFIPIILGAIALLAFTVRLGIRSFQIRLFLYIVYYILIWIFSLFLGIQPTISAVIIGLIISIDDGDKIEKKIAPLIHRFVLPLFIFVNSSIHFDNFEYDILLNSGVLGIILGLFLGKQAGIMLTYIIFSKMRLVSMSKNTSLGQFYGASILCGIGFTMSIFIGQLSFDGTLCNLYFNNAKIGIMIGSALSVFFGSILISYFSKF